MEKSLALKVVAEVETKFARFIEAGWPKPYLFDGTHEELDEDSWVISWEEGPDDWAMNAWPSEVPGVFVEPINSFTLAVHPE